MGWGCYVHEMDTGSDAWDAAVKEITPENCVPWGRDGQVCPSCHREMMVERAELISLVKAMRNELYRERRDVAQADALLARIEFDDRFRSERR